MKLSRAVLVALFAALICVSSVRASEDTEAIADDIDDQIEKINADVQAEAEGEGEAPPMSGMNPSETAETDEYLDGLDSHLNGEQKEERMKSCLTLTRQRLTEEDSQKTIQMLIEQRKMNPNHAVNAIAHEMLVSCYFSFDVKDPATVTEAPAINMLLSRKPDTPRTMSKNHGAILQKLIKSEKPQEGAPRMEPTALGVSGWSGMTKVLWLLGVLGSFFGFAIWGVIRLMHQEEKVKQKSSRSVKKEAAKMRQAEKKKL